jgi:hypothetical protein
MAELVRTVLSAAFAGADPETTAAATAALETVAGLAILYALDTGEPVDLRAAKLDDTFMYKGHEQTPLTLAVEKGDPDMVGSVVSPFPPPIAI